MTYSEKLKDPRWQKKRLEILSRDGFACQRCYDDESTLHVHHRRYIPGRDPWDYPPEMLVTLCAKCHDDETEMLEESIGILCETVRDKFFSAEIHSLACAIHYMHLGHPPEVVMSAIEWALSPNQYDWMMGAYFDHIKTHKAQKQAAVPPETTGEE
jgi:hypothetical protein